MSFLKLITIEFAHCDPAGIVFYPRYFEMVNSVIEGMFRDHLGWSFANISGAAGNGVPTVAISTQFHAPSKVGDVVDFNLSVTGLGRSSVSFQIIGSCAGQLRLEVASTLVWLEAHRPAPWPEAMRQGLASLQHAVEESRP